MKIPKGWRLVPVEWRDEQATAMADAYDKWSDPECVKNWLFCKPMYDAALAAAPTPPAQDDGWKEVERLLTTIRYIQGIAEHGEKRQMRDDETLEQFVLGYVKKLEGRVSAQEAEPVAWMYGNQIWPGSRTWEGYEDKVTWLYTHAPSDKLRQAAEEELLEEIRLHTERDADAGWKGIWDAAFALSAALEGKS
jgi:hypothetical protein